MASISRGQPRWSLPFRYRRIPELAPNDAAWNAADAAGYEAEYLAQLEGIGATAILDRLERISAGRHLVLLCWERPGETFCHRWLLSRYVHEETGQVIRELQAGDLPQREDLPEMRLF
jgi:hypothetical protein